MLVLIVCRLQVRHGRQPVRLERRISCSTCHVNGASNARLFIPGMSSHPGNFDTTGAFFNAPSDDHRLDPLTIPSLRGARLLAPYGHDGRFASLRDFARNVVVNEFGGAEPSPAILDAIVAYIEDIEFLPNPRIRRDGQLARGASAAARRGAVLFTKPFPHDPGMSCASCHLPANAFVDHSRHDVGSGGSFKTPPCSTPISTRPTFTTAASNPMQKWSATSIVSSSLASDLPIDRTSSRISTLSAMANAARSRTASKPG
jgi:cytochrome c peroxidase